MSLQPDQFCCWITQQRTLDQRNVFQSWKNCMLCASLRSVRVFTCRCTDCIKSCVLGKLLFIAIFRVFVAVACELAQHCNVERDILKIARIFTNICSFVVQYLTVKSSCFSLALRLKGLHKMAELSDVLFANSIWTKMIFLST